MDQEAPNDPICITIILSYAMHAIHALSICTNIIMKSTVLHSYKNLQPLAM